MAEQDKDLPLVVAEILIEMHGMNNRLKAVENRLNNVENLLVQVVDGVHHLSSTVKQAAENAEKQADINSRNFQLLVEADQRNTNMLAASFQSALAVIGRRFDSLENRLERLETT